jgi:hypothetical protein
MRLITVERKKQNRNRDAAKSPLVDRIKNKAGIALVGLGIPLAGAGCIFDTSGVPASDALVTESRMDISLERRADSSISKDIPKDLRLELSVLDKGVDSAADINIDVVSDTAVDSISPICPTAKKDSWSGLIYKSQPAKTIGGYDIEYLGKNASGDPLFKITCNSNKAIVKASAAFVDKGESILKIQEDNFQIRINCIAAGPSAVDVFVYVEPLQP